MLLPPPLEPGPGATKEEKECHKMTDDLFCQPAYKEEKNVDAEVLVADVCGTTYTKGSLLIKCQERKANAMLTSGGVYVCPSCQAIIAPDFADPFLTELVSVSGGTGTSKKASLKKKKEDGAEDDDEDGYSSVTNERQQTVADRKGHLKAAFTTIDNCVQGLGLPGEVTRSAKAFFEKMLDFCNSSKSRQSRKTLKVSKKLSKKDSEKGEKKGADRGAVEHQKHNHQKKISGRRTALVVAIVELCALQCGTPRLHDEVVVFTGVSSIKIRKQRKLLVALGKEEPALFDVQYDRPKVCMGYVKLLLARLLVLDFNAMVKQFTSQQKQQINDVTKMSVFQRDTKLQALLRIAEECVQVLCRSVSDTSVSSSSTAKMDVAPDDAKTNHNKKPPRTKKVKKNREAIMAAAALLAASETTEYYREYLSYAIFKEWFNFFTKAIHDDYQVLVHSPLLTTFKVPDYTRRSKLKLKKAPRGNIPVRHAN